MKKYIYLNYSHITHHLAQLDNASASILVSPNSLDNCGLGLRLNLFLDLKQEPIIKTRHKPTSVMCIWLLLSFIA